MASIALHLKSHPHKTLFISSPQTLTFPHLFSSSSSSDNNGGDSDFSSRFADIKSRLKQHQQQQNVGSTPFTSRKGASLDEIRKNLSEFRLRSSPQQQQQPPSLQDLYKKNIPNPNGGRPSFEVIQESLRQMRDKPDRPKTGVSPNRSFTQYMENFKIRPESGATASKVYGGSTEGLPISVFGKEMSEREKKMKGGKEGESAEDDFAKAELIRPYSHPELGEKLRELRGESDKGEKEKSGFSLKELNERLKKLREIEENKQVGTGMGFSHGELRSGLQQILHSRDANSRKPDFPRIDILSQMDGTRAFLLHPPKEQLIEKYFHPDNMSSEEKLKLELKKVRDEFKMHESDCGSARVQIAQLTREISHLSSVLHKKDKHSRKGLLGKVQQRKKLLKYLRRTDWDSYCFVLSKLGLRDNPDYKH